MNERIYAKIAHDLTKDLTTELKNDVDFNADILAVKVRSALMEIVSRRKYANANYTDEMIEKDLWNFYSVALNVARYDYNQIGTEGESTHVDNGIERKWVDRDTFFKGVIPLAIIV